MLRRRPGCRGARRRARGRPAGAPPRASASRARLPETRGRRRGAAPPALSSAGRGRESRGRSRGDPPLPPGPRGRDAARGAATAGWPRRAGVFVSSGMTRAGSTAQRSPRPSQVGQAPWALLNENTRGESSPTEMSQRTQAMRRESSFSRPPSNDTSTTSCGEVQGLLETRPQPLLGPGRRISRSMRTSIRWLRRGSSSSGSARFRPLPSTRARTRPTLIEGGDLLLEGTLSAARHRGQDGEGRALGVLQQPLRHLLGASGRRWARRSGGSGAGRERRTAREDGRRSR